MSRVGLFEAIRRDARWEELSVRALAKRYGVHRRTVRQALGSPVPPPRKSRVRVAPKLDPVKPLIDAMLREDLTAPRKQRHTARRVLARLVDEHGVGDITYSTVRDYVRARRVEINAEAGRCVEEAFVPQSHDPGAEAEVDFADLWIDLKGLRTKVFLFTLRLSYSGKAVHRVFASQGQEAFLEGHVYAFDRLGGVPITHIRYDNLKSAVSRVLLGRNRIESERWVLFRSWYGFEAFYCERGLHGAHEKGGVEGEGGRFRRTHLVPVPRVDSLDELNERLAGYDEADDFRRIGNRAATVGQDFATEQPLLRPLPVEPFEPGLTLTARVDRYAQATVRTCRYSVPVRLIGRRVRVLLRASELLIFDGGAQIARHQRCTTKGGSVLLLDHYLEVLARKPGALPGSTALAQARQCGGFTAAHDAFWAAARARLGDSAGTRALIEVLLLHRHMHHADVVAGLIAAGTVGASSADVVAVEARKAADRSRDGTVPAPRPTPWAGEPVVSLTQRRLADPAAVIAGLPADHRPPPSVSAYDELLPRRRASSESAKVKQHKGTAL
ncbi:IS21 family transposase [Mycolicibacterium tusciae]|uniref:IS21 family transposase n=1 Tax=Mycolicibacterium tusciae TaxID=75922 RepID=UPI001EF92F3C|nr:IS21 family transposase [Mycolicibacterium tusciae]